MGLLPTGAGELMLSLTAQARKKLGKDIGDRVAVRLRSRDIQLPPLPPFACPSPVRRSRMATYLISFPAEAMQLTPDEFEQSSVDSHAVIEELKAAGAYVFGGGIDDSVAPVRVAADGAASEGTYPGSHLTGGFLVIEVPDRDAAIEWAAKVAAACRCDQELRVFGYDPAS